jgi:hypothetical protein
MPYWTTDIGGYWGHSVDWSTSANNELFTRWFQYGAFCPIFRIHGGGSRELYGNQWSATTKANLLTIDNLRYRLMPYIYSLAWKVTHEGYSIMRPLVFDYRNDSNVFNIKDQFLFGPAFLVNPVTSAGATSRSVYLPSGTWYNFWTGSTQNGGSRISASAPLSEIPLFIKAGSIVPMGPNIQYATQSIDPLEIRVYKGQNGSFTLYEDQGDTYNYESGQYSQIPFIWNESTQQLTIGARTGSYSGMPVNRTFNIVWVTSNHGNGVNVSVADQAVDYDGTQVVVNSSSIPTTPTPTLTPTVTPTPTPTPAGSYVRFRNAATGLYIDGMGSTSNGSNACQWSDSNSTNQQWAIVNSGGYVMIQNRATGLYLDGMGRTGSGSVCGQWANSGSANQQWTQEASGNYVRFKNRATGLYLDGMGSTGNGSNLCQWGSSGSANQQWQIQ